LLELKALVRNVICKAGDERYVHENPRDSEQAPAGVQQSVGIPHSWKEPNDSYFKRRQEK
jgi:hypothetical protein